MSDFYPFLFDVVILALLLVSVYQQHQTRATVRRSTPVQLAEAVRDVRAQLEALNTLLDVPSIQEIRERQSQQGRMLTDHEKRLAALETEIG